MIGKIVGNYKIVKKLGEGGMGAVYQGIDTMLDREVAIKALRPELTSQTAVVERFRSEAVTLAKLNHPNVATLYTMFRHSEELYMVIEFVKGETLDNILQRRGALSAEEVIPVFCQILDGIDHAHELGIVHRDIKPANMMLTEKGTLKVLDFGIARLLGSSRMTRAGNIIGTLEYMAPEQVKGQETDARSDIYALGMMLYEVLTGRTPFDTENEFELMKLQVEAMPPRPREINSAIPLEIESAILRAIQKDPNARFQTAGEFRETLIDAGFAAKGVMRASTGSYAELKRNPSAGISKAGVTEKLPSFDKTLPLEVKTEKQFSPPGNTPKETKLGAGVAVAAAAGNPILKATRLGTFDAAATATTISSQETAAPSFFSKLTSIHYIGAGSAALVLIATLIVIPVLIISTRSGSPTNKTENGKVENTPEKPAIVQAPKPQQITVSSEPTPIFDNQTSSPNTIPGNGELLATENQGASNSARPAQDKTGTKQSENSANKAKAVTTKTPVKDKRSGRKQSEAERLRELEKILTEN